MPWITSVLISKKTSQYGRVLPLNKANLDLLLDDASVCTSSALKRIAALREDAPDVDGLVSLLTAVTPGMFLEILGLDGEIGARPG